MHNAEKTVDKQDLLDDRCRVSSNRVTYLARIDRSGSTGKIVKTCKTGHIAPKCLCKTGQYAPFCILCP